MGSRGRRSRAGTLVVALCCLRLAGAVDGQTKGTAVTDTAGHSDAVPPRVPWSEFTWAGARRYTMDGAQPNLTTQIRPVPAAISGGVYFGTLVWLHIYQERTIWLAKSSFRIDDNFDESLSANYGGHFAGGYVLSSVSSDMLLTSGFSLRMATICGTLMGFAYQFYVEALDGYGKDYGFSPYEFYAQTLGCIYYYASCSSAFLQNFVPKADYYPAPWFGDKQKYLAKTPIDDYSAWTFWMSANVHNLLPEPAGKHYPEWLNLAVGYSARNLGYPDRYRVLVVGLDFNLAKILPEGGDVWNWWRQSFQFVKIPGPALEFHERGPTRFYFVFPFKIHL